MPTVSESTEEFCAMKARTRSPATVRQIRMTYKGFVRLIGDLQTANLTEVHFDRAFARWSADNMPATYNKKLIHMGQWLEYASRKRQLGSSTRYDLLSMVERMTVTPRRRLYLTAADLTALMDACAHPRDRIYLAMAIHTGLRSSEIISLTLDDVDLDGGNLYVLRHKTNTRDVFPITQDLDAELRRWLVHYTEMIGALGNDFLLVPAKSTPTWDNSVYPAVPNMAGQRLRPHARIQNGHTILQELLRRAGYPIAQEGLHTIRRSVARLSYDHLLTIGEARDEAVSIVQATLGHASPDITLQYIGVERGRERRDSVMRGKPFLSAMLGDQTNVKRLFTEVG